MPEIPAFAQTFETQAKTFQARKQAGKVEDVRKVLDTIRHDLDQDIAFYDQLKLDLSRLHADMQNIHKGMLTGDITLGDALDTFENVHEPTLEMYRFDLVNTIEASKQHDSIARLRFDSATTGFSRTYEKQQVSVRIGMAYLIQQYDNIRDSYMADELGPLHAAPQMKHPLYGSLSNIYGRYIQLENRLHNLENCAVLMRDKVDNRLEQKDPQFSPVVFSGDQPQLNPGGAKQYIHPAHNVVL